MSVLLVRHPFWGALALNLRLQVDERLPHAAATDGVAIYLHPAKLAEFDPGTFPLIVMEEVGHCALRHHARRPAGADPRLWNRACDQEIRWMIEGENEAAAQQQRPAPWSWPGDQFRPEERFRGLAAEHVYAQLLQESPAPPPAQRPGGDRPSSSPSPGAPPPGPSAPGPAGSPGTPDAPGEESGDDPGALGDMLPLAGDSPSDQAALSHAWEQRLLQAVRMGKARGSVPGQAHRQAEALIHPRQDPFGLLREWLTAMGGDDYNWSRPNRRWSESEFFLPAVDSPRCGRIVFATDTSGSISPRMLAQFRGIKQWALDELKPTGLTDIFLDARVQHVRRYEPGEEIPDDHPGGGGTDFRPAFTLTEQEWQETDPVRALVFLTDLDGTFPEHAPDFQVLWLSTDPRRNAPFGTVIPLPAT